MLKLGGKLLLLFALIVGTYVAIWLFFLVFPYAPDSYFAANTDKHKILSETRSPKIIFVGGSNISFGLDSSRIEKQLHRPVVNMGFWVETGLRFMLNEVKPYVQAGDVIVIVPEYDLFFGFHEGTDNGLTQLIILNPLAIRYLSRFSQVLAILKSTPVIMDAVVARVKNMLSFQKSVPASGLYFRKGFNAYGDYAADIVDTNGVAEIPVWRLDQYDPSAVRLLHAFHAYGTKKRATVVLSFPSISAEFYAMNRENIDRLYAAMMRESPVKMINAPTDYVFSRPYLFDSPYHVNKDGRIIRTEKLIHDIETVLKK